MGSDGIGSANVLAAYDLDLLHWSANGQKRQEHESRALVAEFAAGHNWIIEGVYGWLAEIALPRATGLIWLDLPWSECKDALLRRGLRRGMAQSDQDGLIAWAGAYWSRDTSSSFAGHELLYATFSGPKWHLRSRAEINHLLFSPFLGPAHLVSGWSASALSYFHKSEK